jgi:putative helicase MOV10L1
MLRARGLAAVRVGTVDDFQGQEADAVIVSTVHAAPAAAGPAPSGPPPEAVPAALTDARRFNVAITRARRLLVVVGDPVALAPAQPWRELMRHAAARGAFMGAGAEVLGGLSAGGGGGGQPGWLDAPLPPTAPADGPGRASETAPAATGDGTDGGLAAVMARIASLALLGAGTAARRHVGGAWGGGNDEMGGGGGGNGGGAWGEDEVGGGGGGLSRVEV